jgi:hypothetical protein
MKFKNLTDNVTKKLNENRITHERNWENKNMVYEIKPNQVTIGPSENNKIFVIDSKVDDYLNPIKEVTWFVWSEDLIAWQKFDLDSQIIDEKTYTEIELVDLILLKLQPN